MSIPGSASPLFFQTAAAAASDAGPIKSLRFNAADSAFLNRTPSSTGNRRTMTLSFWYKNTFKSVSQLQQVFIAAQFTSPAKDYYTKFGRLDDGSLLFNSRQGGSDYFTLRTSQVLRDPSAWYHIVLAIDTTQATAENRVKLYINGSQVTDFQTETYPSQNQNMDYLNENQLHFIGRYLDNSYEYFDGYLTDYYFIDGSQLEPTSFGESDDNGVWQPSSFSGTFGSNGFHLFDFANESTIGHDSSGNNNDFTANNISAESGNGNYISELNSVNDFYGNGRAKWGPTLFNGATGDKGPIPAAGSPMTYTPSSSITLTGTGLRIWVARNKGGLYINGNSVSSTEQQWNSFGTTYSPLSSIEWRTTDGSNFSQLSAIEINGTQLIDSSAVGPDLDVLFDAPKNDTTNTDSGAGGELSGNYPTFNPLSQQYSTANHVLTNGNLQVGDGSTSKGNYALEIATMAAPPSNKWYWEMKLDDKNSAERRCIGVVASDADFATYLPQDNLDDGFVGLWCETGQKIINGSRTSYGASATDGDIIGVALDQDGNTVTFYKNNSSQGSISLPTNMQGKSILPAVISIQQDENVIANFGQRAWAYSAPSNHKALCTTNLPTPTIADGRDHYDAKLWTGNSTDQRAITGYQFSPDLVYVKRRNASYGGIMMDTVRGLNSGHAGTLYTNVNSAEDTGATSSIRSFNSDGFNLGTDGGINYSGSTYIGWAWDAGSSTVSNTDGSVTSSVRANQSAGFSIVTFTNPSSGAFTVGHGLNAQVGLVIMKHRNRAGDWLTWVSGFSKSEYLALQSTAAKASATEVWGSSAPGSSTFGGKIGVSALAGDTDVAYCFAPVSGYSAMGQYSGISSTDGPFIYTGFRVAWLLIKNITDSGWSWNIYDTTRDPTNPNNKLLRPDYNASEISAYAIDFLSNGFKLKHSDGAINQTSKDYIYAAFAENPFSANGGLAR